MCPHPHPLQHCNGLLKHFPSPSAQVYCPVLLATNSAVNMSLTIWGFHKQNVFILEHHLASLCGDFLKKKYTATAQEAWRTLHVTLNRLLLALTN